MPVPPTPKALLNDVIGAVNFLAGPYAIDRANVVATQRLDIDFRLTGYQRKALAKPFERIATAANGQVVRFSRSVCESLRTVGDAVTLVSKGAGFDGSWIG